MPGQFIELVAQAAATDRETAERATRAVLQTLGERLGSDEGRHLVSHLPEDVGPWLFTEGGAQRFELHEFLRRVAERASLDPAAAEHYANAVFTALGTALDDHAYGRMVARLPKSFTPILPRGRYAGGVPPDELVRTVAERTGSDHDDARRYAEAVLETLAERIGGEADDLKAVLPVWLHPVLEWGQAHPDPDLAADEFFARIAARAQVSPDRAVEVAAAVLAALRETVPSEEYFDVTVQLPPPYWERLGPRVPR